MVNYGNRVAWDAGVTCTALAIALDLGILPGLR